MGKEKELREEKSGFVFVYRMKKQNKKHRNAKFIGKKTENKEWRSLFQFLYDLQHSH